MLSLENLSNMHRAVAAHDKKLKFVLTGAGCFAINSVILYILTKFKVSVALAQMSGYEVGLLFGFYVNSIWTYRHNAQGSTWYSLVKYHGASLSGLIISTLVVVLLNKLLGLHPNLGLIIASMIVMVWNYLLFDRFVFSKQAEASSRKTANLGVIKNALLVFIVWEILMTGFGIWASALHTIAPPPTPSGTPYILTHTFRWDSSWYLGISDANWYKTHPQAAAFYPLYPLLLHGIHYLTGGDFVIIAFLLNLVCSATAFCYLALIVQKVTGNPRKAFIAVLLFAAFPTAFFMHEFYTEALFCALGFSAFYYALQRRWLISCIILGIATASRLPSMFFVAACFLEYLRSINYRYRDIRPQVLYFLITPLGFLLYAYYLYKVYGSPLYMFSAYRVTNSWDYEQFNPNILSTVYRTAHDAIRFLVRKPDGWLFFTLWQFPSLLIWGSGLLLLIYGLLKRFLSLPMVALAFGSALFIVLNNNFVSVDRYMLPLFPLYLVGARLLYSRPRTLGLSLTALGSIELWFFAMFVKGYFIA